MTTADKPAPRPRPLAEQLRPSRLDQVIGQNHLLAEKQPLGQAIRTGKPHSMVLWGPPGSGKTTLARLIASYTEAAFINLSAVLDGVKEVRAAVAKAQQNWQLKQQQTVLFVDEVHRFNKAQQDAFLPYVEDGTLLFIGATTENPSFALNNALLSRLRVYVLKALNVNDIVIILEHAAHELGQESDHLPLSRQQCETIAHAADGDARRALVFLDIAMQLVQGSGDDLTLDEAINAALTEGSVRQFDKGGDIFYQQISALHKAVRGSSPDAALYWFARMLDGGCDPQYIARRLLRMASEDIGNADPRALQIAVQAWQSYERLGSPEGELALGQAVLYLACAAKSNAVYTAFKLARQDAADCGSLAVPMHLRNASTTLLKKLGYGSDYRYAHDEEQGYAAAEDYFPSEIGYRQYYQPVDRGLEIKIGEKLARLRSMDKQARTANKA